MTLVALVLATAALAFFWARSRRKVPGSLTDETTPALDVWLRSALERELAETALGLRGSTAEERTKLTRTLANEPDADIVATLEEKIRAVELEFVRYAHESEIEAKVLVRYEDGSTGSATRRFPPSDIPQTVQNDFAAKGGTRVFRTWSFPWQRARVL